MLQRLEERLHGESDPIAKLRVFVDNHLSFFAANMAEMKVLSHEAESLAGDLHEHVSTRKRQYTRAARKILSEVQQAAASSPRTPRRSARLKGNPRPVDVTVATYALFGMMNWIYNWYDPRGKLSVNQLVDNITRLFLSGFLAPAERTAVQGGSTQAERLPKTSKQQSTRRRSPIAATYGLPECFIRTACRTIRSEGLCSRRPRIGPSSATASSWSA